ncbi:MAG: RDD family protein [Verrucomicrobiia bacterium]
MKNDITKYSRMLWVIFATVYIAAAAVANALSGYAQAVLVKEPKSGIVRIGTNAFIGANETAKGVFVLNGNAVIDGKVEENAMIIRGDAQINGEVLGDVISAFGSVSVGESARIRGNIVLLSSRAKIAPGAEIGGNKIDVDFGKLFPPAIGGLFDYIRYGVLMLRPFPPQVKAVWGIAILWLILSVVLALIFPRAILGCMAAIQNRPVSSFLIGLIGLCLIAPLLMMLLALSVVGVFVIPFVILAIIIAMIFGVIAMYCVIGYRLGRLSGGEGVVSPVVALLIGFVLTTLLYMLPVIGLISYGVITMIGFGAALISAVEGIFKETSGSLKAAKETTAPQGEIVKQGQKQTEPCGAAGAVQVNAAGMSQQAEAEKPIQEVSKEVGSGAGVRPEEQVSAVQQTAIAGEPPIIQGEERRVLEKPPIDYSAMPRVGFWRRFVATLIDLCLFAILFVIFHEFGWILWMVYHFVMWGINGATVGDIVMRIKIVKEDGAPIDWKVALIRTLASLLSAVPLFIGFFWAGWFSEKKAWHDYIAGTIVVKLPAGSVKGVYLNH